MSDILSRTIYFNTVTTWLVAFAVFVVAAVALSALRGVVHRRLQALEKRTGVMAFGLAAALAERTRTPFLGLFALYIGSRFLVLPPSLTDLIDGIAVVVVLVQAALWGTWAIAEWLKREAARRAAAGAEGAAISALATPAKLTIWALVVLLALDNLGIDVKTLIAGLGIGGVAIALATQNIVGDLFASLSIAFDRPFEAGDFIIVGDQLGTVERIGLKSTRVRALSGELIVFSNSDLLASRIHNYKQMRELRVVFGLGVVYQTSAETVAAIPGIVREAIESQPNTRFDRGHFKAFGPFSLDFEFVYYMLVPDYNAYMDTQQAVNLAVMGAFAERGIEFAYPTQTVFVAHEAEA